MKKLNIKFMFSVVILFVYALISIHILMGYDRINKELTIFLMPLLHIIMLIGGIVVLLILVAMVNKLRKSVGMYVNIFICLILILFNLYNFLSPPIAIGNFEKYLLKREEIIQKIEKGKIEFTEKGVIELPNAEEYLGISDGNRIILVKFNGKTGVYFYTFSGLLETTAGYIYFTDGISEEECIDLDLVNIEQIEGNWYSCATN